MRFRDLLLVGLLVCLVVFGVLLFLKSPSHKPKSITMPSVGLGEGRTTIVSGGRGSKATKVWTLKADTAPGEIAPLQAPQRPQSIPEIWQKKTEGLLAKWRSAQNELRFWKKQLEDAPEQIRVAAEYMKRTGKDHDAELQKAIQSLSVDPQQS